MAEITETQPRWTRRKEDRPGEILTAALEVFSEKGFSKARLEDVAARADVSKGTLYLYFKDKEELFRKVIEHAVMPNVAAFENLFAGGKLSAEDMLRTIVTRLAVLVGTTPMGALPKLIIAESENFPAIAEFYRDNVILRMAGLFKAILDEGIKSGEFRQIDSEYTSRVLASPLFFLAILKSIKIVDEVWKIDPERHAEAALDLFLGGLRVTANDGDTK